MDFRFPLDPDDSLIPCCHGPVRLWMLAALIVAVLAAAAIFAGLERDTRDTTQRHATVLLHGGAFLPR